MQRREVGELTKIRFWSSSSRIFMGWNNFGMALPSGWGVNAVPAGTAWAGVKKETLEAAGTWRTDADIV